ncbi:MAG: TetR/AcrR family transcriptional regulator [Pseudomonadota bacterium]
MTERRPKEVSARKRVLSTAESIIRSNGVDALTMRRLANEASVALKTPYNLFGSKTGVLLDLLNQATIALVENLATDQDEPAVIQLFKALVTLETFYADDEEYYRTIFWAVMTSDHPEERAAAHANIVALVTLKIKEASSNGELKQSAGPMELGEQLGLNLLANLGSWAGGHLSIQVTIAHTRTVWAALLTPLASRKLSVELVKLITHHGER